MRLTRSFKELVQWRVASDTAFADALLVDEEGRAENTPARRALLAFAKAWTCPVLGNEDVPVTNRLFDQARALAKNVAASAADPPEFGGWLEILGDKSREGSNEWQGTLHAVTDYFGLSKDK